MRGMTKVFLKKKIQNRVLLGHPWIFGNEVGQIEGEVSPGDIVDVFTHNGVFVGRGYINSQSQILVRLLTRNKQEQVNDVFFFNRLQKAWEYRKKIGYVENCRLVFGEADELPALIIDKFNDYLVIQTLAWGMDRWKPAIVAALEKIFTPKGIYERNYVPVRELEGLPQQKGFLSAPFDTNIILNENGLRFHVDIENGQKTGYFLDQQDNRRAIPAYRERGRRTGSILLYRYILLPRRLLRRQKRARPRHIRACRCHCPPQCGTEQPAGHLQLPGRECVRPAEAVDQGRKNYDVVILDPPAFTKSRENIQKAITGYKEINLRGMKLLKPGGFLVTASCTNLVNPSLFLEIIDMAAKDARKKLRQVTFLTQAQDHPILWNIENTTYLKFLIVEVQ